MSLDADEIGRRLGFTDVKEAVESGGLFGGTTTATSAVPDASCGGGGGRPSSPSPSKKQSPSRSASGSANNKQSKCNGGSKNQQAQARKQRPRSSRPPEHAPQQQREKSSPREVIGEEDQFDEKKVYKKLISPSKRSRELMRQVSGLGMEDPVFGTREKSPAHPSQIFEDMSVNDLPEDMRDMVSVHSDPTATFDDGGFGDDAGGGGLDMALYQASLGDMQASTNSDFSNMELAIPQSAQSAILAAAKAACAAAEVKSVSDSSLDHDGGNGDNNPLPGRKMRKRISVRLKKRRDKVGGSGAAESAAMKDLNASIGTLQSLDLDDVINASKADRDGRMGKSTEETGHSSGRSRHSRNSRGSKGNTVGSKDSNDDSNNLIREAALAMQKEGNASTELIVAALSQSISDMYCSADDLNSHQPHHQPTPPLLSGGPTRQRKPSNNCNHSYEAPEPCGSNGNADKDKTRSTNPDSSNNRSSRKTRLPAKQRAMPNLNSLFPDAAVSTPTKRNRVRAGAGGIRRATSSDGGSSGDLAEMQQQLRQLSQSQPQLNFDHQDVRKQSASSGAASRVVKAAPLSAYNELLMRQVREKIDAAGGGGFAPSATGAIGALPGGEGSSSNGGKTRVALRSKRRTNAA